MVAPVTVSESDPRAWLEIVSDVRADLRAEGLPPSLLADLMGQIRCDVVAFAGFDSGRQHMWSAQLMADSSMAMVEGLAPVRWDNYWHCQLCSYPDRTGDLRSIEDLGLLLGPAMALHRLRDQPADGVRT